MTPADELRAAADKLRTAVFRGAMTATPAVAALLAAREPLAALLESHAASYEAALVAADRVFAPDAAERKKFIMQQTDTNALGVARAVLRTWPS